MSLEDRQAIPPVLAAVKHISLLRGLLEFSTILHWPTISTPKSNNIYHLLVQFRSGKEHATTNLCSKKRMDQQTKGLLAEPSAT